MRPKPIATAFIACVCLSLLVSAQTRPTLEIYRNAEHGFQMGYLSTWKPQAGGQPWIIVTFAPASEADQRQTRAAVGIPPLKDHQPGQPIHLQEIANVMVDEMKTGLTDSKIVVSAESKLAGEPAWRVILTARGGDNTEMKLLVIAAAHNDRPYIVGIRAPNEEWDRSRSGFDRLVETFMFIEPQKK